MIALRRGKGMVLDPADPDTTSAGSFFTNPILDARGLAGLRERVSAVLGEQASLPVFPEADGRVEGERGVAHRARGLREGVCAGPRRHLLEACARAHEPRRRDDGRSPRPRARTIRDGVKAKFGVTLENEPVFVGVAL